MNPAVYFLSSIKSTGYNYVPTEVTIGTQIWDQKNLDTIYYSDGTLIPNNTSTWSTTTIGGWRYHGDNSSNGPLYGVLYNNFAYQGKFDGTANRKSVAPTGWRVATAADFTTLSSYLSTNVGGKMKETGLTYWNTPNTSADNSSGFSGRGSSYKTGSDNTTFGVLKNTCFIWTESTTGVRLDYNTDTLVFETALDNGRGSAIRLIKILVNLTTTSVTGQTQSQLVSGSNVTSTNGLTLSERGICYSTSSSPTILDSKVIASSTGTGSIAATISGLPFLTTYYIRAYAITSFGTVFYGTQVSGATTAPVVTLTTTAVTVGGVTSLNSGGSITDDGGYAVTSRGVCWGTSTNPTKGSANFTVNGDGIGSFTSNITGLDGGKLYYVRAYAITAYGTYYGAQQSNTTTAPGTSITTGAYSNVNAISVKGTATAFTNDGTYPITEVGFCWGTSITPTRVSGSYVANGTTVATFTDLSSGDILSPNITYYIRAYAYSSSVNYVAYGAYVGPFTTPTAVPSFTTNVASGVTPTSITSGGTITQTNGVPIVQKGICWSKTISSPTILDSSFTTEGSGSANFTSTTTGILTYGSSYFIRAYITNTYGGSTYTYYSNTINPSTTTPTIAITTTVPSAIRALSVTSGVTVTNDGGAYPINSRGLCWGATSNPVKGTNNFAQPAGIGSFTGSSDSSGYNLTPATSYYIRAYAVNDVTGYIAYGGTGEYFTTATGISTLTTTSATSTGKTTGTGIGTITDSAGYAVTVSGICWNTAGNPTTSSSKTTNGYSGGIVTSASPQSCGTGLMTGLTATTLYYVKAYVTTAAGVTTYGGQLSFTTDSADILRAAYSLRQAVDGYTGNVIRVRRLSTSTYLDVKLNPSTLCIDKDSPFTHVSGPATAATTFGGFCGIAGSTGTIETASTIYVQIWYDQSGNARNVSQTTTSTRQPTISVGGVLNIAGPNNKAALKFTRANSSWMDFTDTSLQLNNTQVYTVCNSDSYTSTTFGQVAVSLHSTNRYYSGVFGIGTGSLTTGAEWLGYGATSASYASLLLKTPAIATSQLFYSCSTATYIQGWVNNIIAGLYTEANLAYSQSINIGATGTGSIVHFNGSIQEVQIYTPVGTTNRNEKSLEIMGYYGIT